MAAACVNLPVSLRLEKALQLKDLNKSGALYNTLLDDCDQPQVHNDIIKDLATMFVRHNAHKVFGVHLIHGHYKTPKDTVVLGNTFGEYGLRWTKPMAIKEIDRSAVHGHVFVVTEDGLCPYELEGGPLPDLSDVDGGFLAELICYLVDHNLTSLLGLQVLGCGTESMYELILDQGTVMIESSFVKGVKPTRVTGWKFESVDGRPRVCAANEQHAALVNGNHKVYNVGKPLPKLESVEELRNALVEAGVY